MKQLFDNLMALCQGEDASFFHKDFKYEDDVFRIFNYHLASYTDFMKPDALEARGIMFKMNGENPLRLSSRPPRKFFNLNENPLTIDLDHNNAIDFMIKADGSLISSYLYGMFKLGLKSKGSLESDQARAAMAWLLLPENKDFYHDVYELTVQGWTVNMEYVAPDNRIVLAYQKPELLVLNIRNNETGMTLYKNQVYSNKNLRWIDSLPLSKIHDKKTFISIIPSMTYIEGFVIRYKQGHFDDDLLVKHKTTWYLTLHHTKDSITIPRRLFECVVNETTDDLRSLFSTDEWSLNRIKEMEDLVIPKLNHMEHRVLNFFEENKTLNRKDYAIKGQKELGPFFSLGMTKYLAAQGLYTGDVNFKEFAIKNYKMFGVKDEELVRE